MSLTTSEMTPADLAAVTNNNGGFGGFGDGSWFIIILFLFAFLGWGNGNGFTGNGGGAADNYVLTSDFAQVERKLDSITNGLCDGFYTNAQLVNGVQMQMANGFAQAQLERSNGQFATVQAINGVGSQLQQCCCDAKYENLVNANNTQNAINTGFCQTNYNNANNTRDILENQNANARAILDALQSEKMEALKERIAEQNQQIYALNLAASQSRQNEYLIGQLRPCPIPAYTVANPYCCQGNYSNYNNCGCA